MASSSSQSTKVWTYGDVKRDLCTDFKLYEEYVKEYVCCVCSILYPSIHTTECGHVVCVTCATALLKDSCPECTQPLTKPRVTETRILSRKVSSGIQLRCVWSTCTMMCKFDEWLAHINQKCLLRPRDCFDCGTTVTQGLYDDHQARECKAKWMDCKICHTHHRIEECPTSIITCPYTIYGCDQKGRRDWICNLHAVECHTKHVQFVETFVGNLQQRLQLSELLYNESEKDDDDIQGGGGNDNHNSNKKKRKRLDPSSITLPHPLQRKQPTEIGERWSLIDSILAIPNHNDRPHVMVADSINKWFIGVLQKRVKSINDLSAVCFPGFNTGTNESIPTMSGRIRPLFPTRDAQKAFYNGLQLGDHLDVLIEEKIKDGEPPDWFWTQGIVVDLMSKISVTVKITTKPKHLKNPVTLISFYYSTMSLYNKCAPFDTFYGRENYSPLLYPPRHVEENPPLSFSSSLLSPSSASSFPLL